MGMCVIVYPSARESGEQMDTQTDEDWIERVRKPKNSAQNGVWKILWEARKKFLTSGGECARIHQVEISSTGTCKKPQKVLKKVLDKQETT